jgi:hypothetical protein
MCLRLSGHNGLRHLPGEISFKDFLRACLAADGLICRAERRYGQVWSADKAVLIDKRDEPVIGLATDVGASGSGAFNGGN